jgi:pyruvate/2-oxoglutarate dehydrogenase complex dihydrolipoamide dehydrogenase (E3) component
MIKIVTNSRGSGDWVIVEQDGEELFAGHRVTNLEVASLLEQLGHEVDLVEIDDTQLNEGMY